MKILVLNGPPQSGKDTLANELMKDASQQWKHIKLAQPMRDYVCEKFDIEDNKIELIKDMIPYVAGSTDTRTIRQHMIDHVKMLKERHGDGVLGLIAANELILQGYQLKNDVIIITDAGGFAEEYWAMITELARASINRSCICVHVIRIQRDGHTFKKDARKYFNEVEIAAPDHIFRGVGSRCLYHCTIDDVYNYEGNDGINLMTAKVKEIITNNL